MFNQISSIRFPRVIAFALILGVVVPSACVLWFMLEAMRNERLASQQRIIDVYRSQALNINFLWQRHWHNKLTSLKKLSETQPSPQVFYSAVKKNYASSLIIGNGVDNKGYPTDIATQENNISHTQQWHNARDLEFKHNDPKTAATLYRQIAQNTKNLTISAGAYQAWARCLLKQGDAHRAYKILTHQLNQSRYSKSKNTQGRLIVANALLQALDIIERYKIEPNAKQIIETQLVNLANDYSNQELMTKQRLFIMNSLPGHQDSFLTLSAERMADQYISQFNPIEKHATFNVLNAVSNVKTKDDIQLFLWHVKIPDSNITALFTEKFLQNELSELYSFSKGIQIKLIPPMGSSTYKVESNAANISLPVGSFMPGWSLNVYFDEALVTDKTVNANIAAYLWIGVLLISSIICVFVFIFRYIFKQEKLTHLKNDLMDTVSHELKTPLSSIRMFVEILLNMDYKLNDQAVEYLNLIDIENRRLTRLIDNFLTFSRLDKQKQSFNFSHVNVGKIVSCALAPFQEKHQAKDLIVKIEISDHLPYVKGDPDFLIMVVTNIIENAYKYSKDEKFISISVYATNHDVIIEIKDKGIGLSKSAVKKIFTRFYRDDNKLNRGVEGCGLGLNIAKYIIDSHGGKITVSSETGIGSTFVVSIPILRTQIIHV